MNGERGGDTRMWNRSIIENQFNIIYHDITWIRFPYIKHQLQP